MKRTRDKLTGGTGDVKPQIWTLPALTQETLNTFEEISVPTPVSRLNNRSNGSKATVMEVLKVWANLPNFDADLAATYSRRNSQLQLSTSSLDNTGIFPLSPKVFAFFSRTQMGKAAVGGSFSNVLDSPLEKDLTDGNGNGIIIATDQIYIGGDTEGLADVAAWNVKILYRFVDVGLTEYIGIVQSQSGA